MKRKNKKEVAPKPELDGGGKVNKTNLKAMAKWYQNTGRPGPGAKLGNTNSIKHGFFANRFLNKQEKVLFEIIIGALNQDFSFNRSSDFLQVELVAVHYVKMARCFAAGEYQSAETLDRMIRMHLKDLKATRLAREPQNEKMKKTTPADWATRLLEKMASADIDLTEEDMASEQPATAEKRE